MVFQLLKLSDWCPEQYDAYLDGKKVAYLRLRHGYFSVECPDVGEEVVYEAALPDEGAGCFESPQERDKYLDAAIYAILLWLGKRPEYEIRLDESSIETPKDPFQNGPGSNAARISPGSDA